MMSIRPCQIAAAAFAALFVSGVADAQITDPAKPVPQPVPQVVQAPPSAPVTFGLKGGVNYASIKIEDGEAADAVPLKSVWGGVGGVFIGRQLSSQLGLQLEVLFSQRGAKDDVEVADATVRLTYVDLPLTLHAGTTVANGARLYAFTGPQLGINVKAEVINDMLDDTTDLDDQFKDWDFGWTLGAGVAIRRISLDARYTLGLMDINDTESDIPVKNRTFTVLLGVRLR